MYEFSSRSDAVNKLHDAMVQRMINILSESAFCSIAIPGGSTPLDLFRKLSPKGDLMNAQLDWSRIKVFWVDERFVDHAHIDSNFGQAWKLWLSYYEELLVYPVNTSLDSPYESASKYLELLKTELGTYDDGRIKSPDIVLLGMGADGHIASLFPGMEKIEQYKEVVCTTQPENKQHRISLNFDYISNAACIYLPIFGKSKSKLFTDVSEKKVYLPISRILETCNEINVYRSNQ
jgi:6-phosphogluconolactonase